MESRSKRAASVRASILNTAIFKTPAPLFQKCQKPPTPKRFKRKVEFYVIARFLGKRVIDNKTEYLLAWDRFNITQCSWQEIRPHSGIVGLFAEYEIYHKGMEAIARNLENIDWQRCSTIQPFWARQYLKDLNTPQCISNKQFQEIYGNKGSNAFDSLGYWRYKQIELEWYQIMQQHFGDHQSIYLECWMDNIPPPDFEFIHEYIISNKANSYIKRKNADSKRHMCFNQNQACRYCKNRQYVSYVPSSRSIHEVNLDNIDFSAYNYRIVICSPKECICPGGWSHCCRWIAKNVRRHPLVIFADPRYEGYGVRAITHIKRGEILSEYVGEIIYAKEAGDDVTYQMQCDEKLIIDSRTKGNESRFFAHSCEPNLILIPVFERGEAVECRYRHIFVVIKDINPGEDITFNYHPHMEKPDITTGECRCGAEHCKKWI